MYKVEILLEDKNMAMDIANHYTAKHYSQNNFSAYRIMVSEVKKDDVEQTLSLSEKQKKEKQIREIAMTTPYTYKQVEHIYDKYGYGNTRDILNFCHTYNIDSERL